LQRNSADSQIEKRERKFLKRDHQKKKERKKEKKRQEKEGESGERRSK
jgi:hypothetical protein